MIIINPILAVVAAYLVGGILATVLSVLIVHRIWFSMIDDAEWVDWPAPIGFIICILVFYFSAFTWAWWAPKLLLDWRRGHS